MNLQKIKYLLLGMAVFFAACGCQCSGEREGEISPRASLGRDDMDVVGRDDNSVILSEGHSPESKDLEDEISPRASLGRDDMDVVGRDDMDVVGRDDMDVVGRDDNTVISSEVEKSQAPKRPWTAYDGKVEVDRTVHDFGDILVSDGAVKCSFTVRNISSEPLSLLQVVSSCGCTDVEWTREEIDPGKTGKISATYKNDAGAVPFDKTLTVYVSALKKPFVLHLRGTVHEKAKPLSELYGDVRRGDLGLKSDQIRVGNLEQGGIKTGTAMVANLGRRSVKVDFISLSPQLDVSIDPNPVPAGSVASLNFAVRADRELWGTNVYTAVPVVDGKAFEALRFIAVTKENFSAWTQEQKDNAALPILSESTFDASFLEKGASKDISFAITNKGKSTFHVYKAESDTPGVTISPIDDLPPGAVGSIDLKLDTSALAEGEHTIMLTLYTNSPSRPLVNLFITCVVK